MHIILIETTSVRGFDIVKSLAESGVEVTFVADTMDFFRGDLGYETEIGRASCRERVL